jgi:nucleoid-associated protein YgaU
MSARLLLSAVVLASLPLAACGPVNRAYKQDTGTVERVPPPPAYVPEPVPVMQDESVEAVEFVDNDAEQTQPDAIEPLPEPEPAPAPVRTYTIQKGDNYWKIAKNVYGDPMRMKEIEQANPDVDPKKLQIGDEIVLPD